MGWTTCARHRPTTPSHLLLSTGLTSLSPSKVSTQNLVWATGVPRQTIIRVNSCRSETSVSSAPGKGQKLDTFRVWFIRKSARLLKWLNQSKVCKKPWPIWRTWTSTIYRGFTSTGCCSILMRDWQRKPKWRSLRKRGRRWTHRIRCSSGSGRQPGRRL